MKGYETRIKRTGTKGAGRMGMKELAERAKVAEITINLRERECRFPRRKAP